MKFSEILFEGKPRSNGRAGDAYWELEVDDKAYVVYDENGKEVGRHAFPAIWDSSGARNAAQKDVNAMNVALRAAHKDMIAKQAEAKPLSQIEQMYYDLDQKVKHYQKYIFPKTPEDDILDKETRDLYLDTANKWLEKMIKLGTSPGIRKSVINGTYKPPQ